MSRYTVRVTRDKVVEVESLAAASKAVRDAIEGELGWIGSREWTLHVARKNDGVLVWETLTYNGKPCQKPVCTISYNGRAWDLVGEEIAL
ncbi:MAG: hypothetical protein EPO68_13810 [Planctomycetota bacterium]|nr:MAG: hypothetical protein EPO68_13810 [Planctomycetota bacterium]